MHSFAHRPSAPQQANKSTTPPAVVRHVLSAPGRPLDLATRRLMEARFGHDFSRVRVHHDSLAAESAKAVDAAAYTVGSDIVFGRDKYWPGTEQGRSLLAHELTHVVQQRNVDSATSALVRLGDPSDAAERHADVLDSQPMLRRTPQSAQTSEPKPAETWAGTFIAKPYDLQHTLGHDDIVTGYGANIIITFRAKPFVDADQIGFVQMVQSVMDGKSYNKYDADEKERKTAESRMIPTGKPGAGGHIDSFPRSRTPLYGMVSGQGNDLTGETPGPNVHIGWHYTDPSGKPKNEDAWMHDEPDLNTRDEDTAASAVQAGRWSQQFETAALAISGNQKGIFYGSVQWGWSKELSDKEAHLTEFKPKSQNVPSPVFMAAAKLWNASVTSANKTSIDVPIDELKTLSKDTPLWDSLDINKKVAILAKGTLLEQAGMPPGSYPSRRWFFSKVVVASGPHAKKTGWIWKADLSQP